MKKNYLEPQLKLLQFRVMDRVSNTSDTDQGVGNGESSWMDPFGL